ncbi:MAG: hypothetical protein QNJ89_10345 [Acidimicrobiia bacterium]|nr:hypothetical protein [Acidimicrobiia bacterium]
MNESQLLEQLAATDAYAPELPLPTAAWSRDAALAEIERRSQMATQTKMPEMTPETQVRERRLGWLAAAAAFGLVLVLGGVLFLFTRGGDLPVTDSATTTAPATVTTTEPTTTIPLATAAPDVLAGQVFAANAGSDPAAWRALQAPDSPVFEPLSWEWLDDFDGDGVTTYADFLQFEIALHTPMGFRSEWECEAESAVTARCVVSNSDVFHALAAVVPPPLTLLETFADGLWIGGECVNCADGDMPRLMDLAVTRRAEELVKYEAWVLENHPDRHSEVFDRTGVEGLIGSSNDLDWVVLPSAIPVHEELLPEYLGSVASPDVLAGQLFAANAGSDPAAWRALQAPDSPVFEPLSWDWLDDFDGDGVTTYADFMQFEIALHGAMGFRFEWECEADSADTARCVVSHSDVFHALAAVDWGDGAYPPPFTLLETFADGLWTGEECVDCADTSVRSLLDLAGSMRSQELVKYEAWVLENRPDRHPLVFDRPGTQGLIGSSNDLDWVVLPSAIPVHEELLLEYLAFVGAPDILPAAPTVQP